MPTLTERLLGPHAGHFGAYPPGQAPDSTPARHLPRPVYKQAAYVAGVGLVAEFGPVPPGRAWLVQRTTIRCSATSIADLYVGQSGDYSEMNRVTSTPAGARDEHDAAQMIPVPADQYLSVVWPTASASATAGARIELWEV